MKKLKTLALVVALLAVAVRAQALTITLTLGAGGLAGDLILGEVFDRTGFSGGALDRDEDMIDAVRALATGTRTGTDPNELYRSTTSFGVLPDATQVGAVGVVPASFVLKGSSPDYLLYTLPVATTYKYLIASYDGPNSGSQIWYIGAVAAGTTFEIPAYAQPSGSPQNLVEGKHFATSFALFNPTTVSVPDGGTAAALLGAAMLGIGYLRRRTR